MTETHPQRDSELSGRLFDVVRLLESHELGVRVAAQHGLTLSWLQVRALWFLGRATAMNQRELRELLGTTAPTTSKLCARLAETGLVAVAPGKDSRERLITLTVEGDSAAQAIHRGASDLVEAAVATWPERERAALVSALEGLYDGLREQSGARVLPEKAVSSDGRPRTRLTPWRRGPRRG